MPSLVDEYREAQRQLHLARLRRVLAIRAMAAVGLSQREIAEELGISQPAVSMQLKSTDVSSLNPEELLEAATPVLKRVAEDHGFTDLAVFGSVARHEARADSDIDLLVKAPPGTTITRLTHLASVFERILGRKVDLITYGALKPGVMTMCDGKLCSSDGPQDRQRTAPHTRLARTRPPRE